MGKEEILGVDIGGVILDFIPYFDTELEYKGERYLETPEVEGSFEALAALNQGRFKDRVFIVSRVDERGPERNLAWMREHKFTERTGIPEEHFHFCTGRHEKAPICKELGITHFVDDRAEVLGHMIGIVPNLYAFQSLNENKEEFKDIEPHIKRFNAWKDLLKELE